MRYNYSTEMTCSQLISFDLDDNVVSNIEFVGGCNGNLKAFSKLVNGWTVEKIEEYLLGTFAAAGPRPARISWPGPFARHMSSKRRERNT